MENQHEQEMNMGNGAAVTYQLDVVIDYEPDIGDEWANMNVGDNFTSSSDSAESGYFSMSDNAR